MKITIIESDEAKFTRDEYKFLQLLEEDKVFESVVTQVREILGFPKNGFDIEKGHGLKKDIKRNILLIKLTVVIRGLYNLPPFWFLILSSIIYYNVAKAVGRKRIPHFHFKKNGDSLTIHVDEKMSIRELKRHIDSNSKNLSSLLSTLPGIPQIKIENIKVKKRILELRNEKKKDAEIARIIENEYGDTLSFSPEYYIISTQRTRFEKSLATLLKTDATRAQNIYNRRFVAKKEPHT